MKVFILTEEPYHDNSSIIGVYLDEEFGVKALKEKPDPTNINEPDYMLTEWDMDTNQGGRKWYMLGEQIREKGPVSWSDKETWRAVRVDFTFEEPK